MLPLLRFYVTDSYLHCSLFTVHNFTKTLVGCGVSYITTEQSAVTLNNAHCSSDVFVFHYFRIFGSFVVCILRGVKIYGPGMLGPLNAGGPLCIAQPAQSIAMPLK